MTAFVLGDLLGEGHFGSIWQAKADKLGTVALKRLRKPRNERSRELLHREVTIHETYVDDGVSLLVAGSMEQLV